MYAHTDRNEESDFWFVQTPLDFCQGVSLNQNLSGMWVCSVRSVVWSWEAQDLWSSRWGRPQAAATAGWRWWWSPWYILTVRFVRILREASHVLFLCMHALHMYYGLMLLQEMVDYFALANNGTSNLENIRVNRRWCVCLEMQIFWGRIWWRLWRLWRRLWAGRGRANPQGWNSHGGLGGDLEGLVPGTQLPGTFVLCFFGTCFHDLISLEVNEHDIALCILKIDITWWLIQTVWICWHVYVYGNSWASDITAATESKYPWKIGHQKFNAGYYIICWPLLLVSRLCLQEPCLRIWWIWQHGHPFSHAIAGDILPCMARDLCIRRLPCLPQAQLLRQTFYPLQTVESPGIGKHKSILIWKVIVACRWPVTRMW